MKKLCGMLAAFMLAAMPSFANNVDNNEINDVYERFARGVAGQNADLVMSAYGEGAIYLRGGDEPPAANLETIRAEFEEMFSAMTDNTERREISFRIISRMTSGSLAVDFGWYRYQNFDADGNIADEDFGRFLTVLTPQKDGRWAIIRDVDTDATQALWDAAKPVPGLYFGE